MRSDQVNISLLPGRNVVNSIMHYIEHERRPDDLVRLLVSLHGPQNHGSRVTRNDEDAVTLLHRPIVGYFRPIIAS